MASVPPHRPEGERELSIGGDSDSVEIVNEKPKMTETDAVPESEVIAVHQLAEKLGDNDGGMAPVADIDLVMDKINILSLDECKAILAKILKNHEYDYNFDDALRTKIRGLMDGPQGSQTVDEWELELRAETAVIHFYSPYPEVRAVTTPDDDVNIACETIRAHLLGYIWVVLAQFVNSLFNSRFPNITIGSAVCQILLYPCGKALALILPDWGFTLGGTRHSLNPGPWTYKEQMLSTIIINVGLVSAYCFWNIQTQTVFYQDKWLTPGYGILLLLSTQLMGLGFAGMMRRFVVYPIEALWPSILPTIALNRALLVDETAKESIHGWRISRYKFFWICFGTMFIYYWLPGYLFPALSYFAWMTWIKPNNFKLAAVTGSQFGLGINPWPTFDWNVMTIYSNALIYPFFAYSQQFLGTILGAMIIMALYFTNTKWTAYLPINSSGIWDNTGNQYNITRVVNPATGQLNEAEWAAYSPAFYSAANLVVYGSFFAFYPFTMVFIALDFWRPMARSIKSAYRAIASQTAYFFRRMGQFGKALSRGQLREAGSHLVHCMDGEGSIYDDFEGPFIDIMRKYPEVPDWWFLSIALVAFIFALIICTHWTQLDAPVWTIFFVIGINLVFLLPMSYLYAISGTTEGLNVVTELIVGYALPGRPEALMFVKAFGYNINGQSDTYLSDQKMGFYAKIPPRAMYRGQLLSAIFTSFVAYGTVQFVDTSIAGICTLEQASGFNCENGSLIYYSSSVVWGAIGPKRIFGEIYPALKWTFLLGFLLALVWWTVKRFGSILRSGAQSALPTSIFNVLNATIFWPISKLKYVHPSLIFNGMLFFAPLNLSYFSTGLYLSFFFMYYLRRYKTAWWERYNYVLTASLTAGVAFSALIIFFAVEYHPKAIHWWGVDVTTRGVDAYAGQLSLLPPPETGFGPSSW